ncbi:acyl-CoA dehydrogenase family protein [Pararoseomonas indoligenes]|uniref:Acyl-CoA dehydrogenase family protein n=1 Tax=Roseomonas indoligenes TaxID=2820811 RepID=A0A940MTL4_9PROT|nr:acyl-CoA dehydrogenase family protein [Pararoseomonas indoligenes]MBP0493189.1 acyl-CoA dehydrogenase family protein [Pararoseomonas indoligenes]
MPDRDFLSWPFLEPRHREWAAEVEAWAAAHAERLSEGETDEACRNLARSMGEAGLLRMAAPESGRLDVRALCIARETLARYSGLADFAFAMQGLGTGSITLFGSDELKARYLPAARAGTALAAFALSEPEAGSDVAALATTALRDGDGWIIDGSKTWISNGGIAATYLVFARTGEAPGAKGLTAFLVPADTPGLTIAERIEVSAPHPLATLRFEGMRVPDSHRLGAPGDGFKVAMATLDVFRATVGAAALGFARHALDLTVQRASDRQLFGGPLFDQQMTQAAIAESAVDVETSALLVYRAAWLKDAGTPRVSREASMAKLHATEAAQRVADRCVQMYGGHGVVHDHPAEKLYREVRALRVYEGASEVQRIIIARAERDIARAERARSEGAV